MNNTRALTQFSRQELYDLIWSTPASKLAIDFGISDVAIAKRCKRLNVPRPSRGYWAKVAAGCKPKKTPLPPTLDEIFKQTTRRRMPKVLPLPGNTEPLHPIASELLSAIAKAKLDSYRRADLREPTLPDVTVSKALAERVAQSFHAILTSLEPLGIPFRKSRSADDHGYFERQHDRLYLRIAEDLMRSDGSRCNPPSWQWPRENGKPSGHLSVSLKAGQYGPGEIKQWSENSKLPLEQLLAQIVAAIRRHYVDAQERREREAIESAKRHAEWLRQTEEWERKEAIRIKLEHERKHAEALAAVVQARKSALLNAAENWRLSRTVLEFVEECERRWRSESHELAVQQMDWLTWSRGIGEALSPFSEGYPDPASDGAFDASLVPFGGPYPARRKFGDTQRR